MNKSYKKKIRAAVRKFIPDLVLILLVKRREWTKTSLLFVALVLVVIILVPRTLNPELNEYRSLKSLGTMYKKVDANNNFPICAYVLNKPSIVFGFE